MIHRSSKNEMLFVMIIEWKANEINTTTKELLCHNSKPSFLVIQINHSLKCLSIWCLITGTHVTIETNTTILVNKH